MDVAQLLRAHLALEGIGVDAQGLMVRIPGPDAEEIPRYYVARSADGCTRLCRADLPAPLRTCLETLSDEVVFSDYPAVERVLAAQAPAQTVWVGVSYVAAREYGPEETRDAVRLGIEHSASLRRLDAELDACERTVFGVLHAGEVVSACASARENGSAAEAWVQTAPAHRGHGFARQATAAWLRHQRAHGRLAFYSHQRDNRASEGVARSLALQSYVCDVGYL